MSMETDTLVAVAQALGQIPGCRLRTHAPSRYRRDFQRLSIDGRSPSLHAMRIPYEIDETLSADAVLEILKPMLALQRRRAQDAVCLGFVSPLEADLNTMGMDGMVIGHLSMDATALGLRLGGHPSGESTAKSRIAIATEVCRIHGSLQGGSRLGTARTLTLADTDVGISDRSDVRTVTGVHAPPGHFGMRYEHRRLAMPGKSVPETTAAAMKGRPLRDLVRIHPLFDDRIVDALTNATAGGIPRLIVQFKPLDVRIGDILGNDGATVREACDAVTAIIREACP